MLTGATTSISHIGDIELHNDLKVVTKVKQRLYYRSHTTNNHRYAKKITQ